MDEQELLAELILYLKYEPESGDLFWKQTDSNRIRVGDKAGYVGKDGRISIRFKGKLYKAHRIIWLLTYGKWPDNVIDHIDGNSSNNRLSNLRDIPQSVNTQNNRKARSNNTSGFLGVSTRDDMGKFQAKIQLMGKVICLGTFLTPEEAHTAYLAVKRKLHEGCTI